MIDQDSPTDPVAAPVSVPAHLAARYRPADRYGFLAGAGARLRYAIWNVPGTPRGTAVVLTGRGEFIEKYATEVVADLMDRGFAVYAMDWRGQGLSDRLLPDRGKGHIDNFTTYIADVRLFLETVVAPTAPRPVLALCHSMGGHILLRHLAENGPGLLSAGVFVSPMTALRREAMLRSILMLMPEVPAVEDRYLFGTGPFVLLAREFASNFVTHDERRYRFTEEWFTADPRLTLGGPTIGWSRQAVRSMAAALAPGYLERIDLPLLLITAGEDRLIDPANHGPIVARLRHGEHFTIANARHEIMMETDDIRALFWEAFDRLAKGVLG
ncbi:MAG: alpha/beta hydrolase [Reyranella sp.]|nr:alpha/beta hydrolase [Reyranella sp.]MDP3160356.1 alpha/beta hydrolase [Reyranella sp.]